jgi:hypothetical protein
VVLRHPLPVHAVIGLDIERLVRLPKPTPPGAWRKAPIAILNTSAQEYDYPEVTAFYLFNPFGAATLNATLTRVFQSWAKSPRSIRISYANPVHETVLAECPWLECYDFWKTNVWRGRTLAVLL